LTSTLLAQQESVKSNQQVIMEFITESITLEIPDSLKSRPYSIILPGATDQSLEALRAALFSKDFSITSNYTNSDQLRFVFDLNNKLYRQDRRSYKRYIGGTITTSIYSEEGLLLWSKTFLIDASDRVPTYMTSAVSTDWSIASFDTVEHRRSSRRVLRYVEPVLISGAVATTIYLLFSVRTQ
jgi:hypothetical protein